MSDRLAADEQPTLGELAEELATIADPNARSRARSFAAALLETHGEALARLLAIVDERADNAGDVVGALLDDALVSSLLVLHDLHPESAEARVAKALDEARRQLGPLGASLGDAVIVEGVVTIALSGPADSPQARVGIQAVLARVLRRHAPDMEALVLPGADPAAASGRRVLPLVASA